MSGSAPYTFESMMDELNRQSPSAGRRSFTPTDLGDYTPRPIHETRKDLLDVVDAADKAQTHGQDSLEAALSELEKQKKLAIRQTRAGAEKTLIDEYRLRRSRDEQAGTPRYQAMLVDSVTQSHRIDKRIEKEDREAGIVTGEPRTVVLYGGSTTLSVGQRIGWSGASAPVEGGASAKILGFTDNPNMSGQPSLRAEVSLDVPTGSKPRIETISLTTPADLKAGLGPRAGQGPKATMSVVKESLPFTYSAHKSNDWYTPSSQSLDTDGVKNMRPASMLVLIDSDAMSPELAFKAMEVSKDVAVVTTKARGENPATLAAGIANAQTKNEPGIKREGEMDVDPRKYDFDLIRKSISDDRPYIVQDGRGPVPTKDRAPIEPRPSSEARAENYKAVGLAGKTIAAQLQSIADRGMMDIKNTIDAADQAAMKTYREVRDQQREARMPRSTFIVVDSPAKTQKYGRKIEQMDREAGIVSGDAQQIVTYGGTISVSVGQRLVATGSFNQDAEALGSGIRQGSSGRVTGFETNQNKVGKPTLYAELELDPDRTGKAGSPQEPRVIKIPLMTPNDLKAGLGPRGDQGPKAVMAVVREDIPFTYEEQKSEDRFTVSSQSLATKGVADTRYAQGILVASPNLTTDVVIRSIGKAEEGIIVHSPARTGQDAARLAGTVAEADERQKVKQENDRAPQNEMETEAGKKQNVKQENDRGPENEVAAEPGETKKGELRVIEGGRGSGQAQASPTAYDERPPSRSSMRS